MSTENRSKINLLFHLQPPGIVLQSSWLVQQGYNHDLQQRYKKSNWLRSIGTGAFICTGDQVSYEGAIYALQKQSGLTVHPGAKTALSLLGKAHYLESASKRIVLFGGSNEKLPAWFRNYDWNATIEYCETSFLPSNLGLTDLATKNLSIKVSGSVRAILECLYLAPKKQELMECLELMEGLNSIPPRQVQTLLENCHSVKVNRLFLYMAEKVNHEWFKYLDLENVYLGKGKRSIVKGGVYVDKYKITVPKELEKYGRHI